MRWQLHRRPRKVKGELDDGLTPVVRDEEEGKEDDDGDDSSGGGDEGDILDKHEHTHISEEKSNTNTSHIVNEMKVPLDEVVKKNDLKDEDVLVGTASISLSESESGERAPDKKPLQPENVKDIQRPWSADHHGGGAERWDMNEARKDTEDGMNRPREASTSRLHRRPYSKLYCFALFLSSKSEHLVSDWFKIVNGDWLGNGLNNCNVCVIKFIDFIPGALSENQLHRLEENESFPAVRERERERERERDGRINFCTPLLILESNKLLISADL